jgi:tripartite-type tricarboxylate transporter receptor subunit TctC
MENDDRPLFPLSRRRVTVVAAMMLASLLAPSLRSAQAYPEKRPITLVVPFAAGGGTDALARELGRYLEQKLGQPIIVDNRGGAGGVIAGQMVARAKPDGHTLYFVTGTFITAAAGDQKLPFDVLKDFTPIALIGRGPLLVVVNKDLNITTLQQLIDQAKAKPEAFNFVSSGPGSILHLAGELFVQRTGIKMTHIPYKGGGPALIDLLSGQAQVIFSTVPTILGHIKSNKVQLLAVTTKERSKLFPDTPTVMESGVKDYDVSTWWGIVGPARLSPQVLAALNQAVNEAAASEGMQRRFEEEGAEAFRGSPADLAAKLESELASWRKVVKDGGLKFE